MPLDGSRNKEVRSFSLGLGLLLIQPRLISASITVLISPPFPFPLLLYPRLSSYQAFLDILNEMNDYAGQRELIAENMMMSICIDLTKYLQELKQERKTVSLRLTRRLMELSLWLHPA